MARYLRETQVFTSGGRRLPKGVSRCSGGTSMRGSRIVKARIVPNPDDCTYH